MPASGAGSDAGATEARLPLDHRCAVCGWSRLETLVRFEAVPVHVGLLWRDPASARSCDRAELDLRLCPRCGYVSNVAFDPARLDYSADYDNALHHSPKFQAWEADLVDELVHRVDPGGGVVLEIGCGDGRFLAMLCTAAGARGIGFEPGHNPERVSELVDRADVRIVAGFAELADVRSADPSLVAARHVLEHVPRPMELLELIQQGCRTGTAVYVEVPDLGWALERGAFEDLMYEHCGYYTPITLAHVMGRTGLATVSAKRTFDGLFAAVIATNGPDRPTGTEVSATVAPAGELHRIRAGARGLVERLERVAAVLGDRHERGQRLVAWGGGARAVGLMNLVTGAANAVERVVDINPRKQGTYVTGTGQPICAPGALVDDPPDAVLVVNPIYRDEIAGMLMEMGVTADLITI